jgi:very-short-patch-repair endonuclease
LLNSNPHPLPLSRLQERGNTIMHKKPYKPVYITEIARKLRRKSTIAEQILWQVLRNRQTLGTKFKRQVPFGRYIADFYSKENRLAIEIDGSSHENKKEYDKNREEIFNSGEIRILRFTNNEVVNNTEYVKIQIMKNIASSYKASPLSR